jgi:hypothetical protein
MLSPRLYARLYEAAKTSSGTLVEIGTAQGAATIAMALGAKAGGSPFHIYTVDPFDRGSRRDVGSISDNVALVSRGFKNFGVEDDITMIVGESTDLAARPEVRDISLLLIDADGQIDRDLALLHDRLAPSSLVVIDDVDDGVVFHVGGCDGVVDQKHRLTHLLCGAFCEMGLLAPLEVVDHTGFYRKGTVDRSATDWDLAVAKAYRQLVFAPFDARQIGLSGVLRRTAAKAKGGLIGLYRRLRYPDR